MGARAPFPYIRIGVLIGNFREVPEKFAKRDLPSRLFLFCNFKARGEFQSNEGIWIRRSGAPGGTRTPDLLVRSQTLYPTELRARSTLFTINSLSQFLLRFQSRAFPALRWSKLGSKRSSPMLPRVPRSRAVNPSRPPH